jgi:glyoxylate/hydroxypyruvate reductase
MTPHIYFNSDIDSPVEWRDALATEFRAFTFSTAEAMDSPDAVDIALIWQLPPQGLKQFRNLRAILCLGAGISQLDPSLLPCHVPLARLVDDSLTRTMVDYAKTAVYRFHRAFHIFEQQSRERTWQFRPPTLTRDTSVGVLGLGEIGSSVAKALGDEGFCVHGWSRTAKQLAGINTYLGWGGLWQMLPRCKIIVNVLPLTDATRAILSSEFFSHCRDGVYLINMGRGGHLVEQDFLAALDSRRIAAATLDVASVEPLPPMDALWNRPDVLITPHVAGISIPRVAVRKVAENIRRALAGQPLLQQVDLARGY